MSNKVSFPTLTNDSFTQSSTGVRLNLADFVKIDSKVEGENRETFYQSTDGTPDTAPTLRIGYYPNAKANGGMGSCNYSIKLTRPINLVNDDDEVVLTVACPFTLAWTLPGLSPIDENHAIACTLNALMQVIYLTETETTLARAAAAQFGITDLLSIDYVDPTP
jgi:hypothetical protein